MTEGLQRHSDEAETWPDRGRRPVVVVGVDGSPASRCAALAAGSSARALGGTVVAVHVPTLSLAVDRCQPRRGPGAGRGPGS